MIKFTQREGMRLECGSVFPSRLPPVSSIVTGSKPESGLSFLNDQNVVNQLLELGIQDILYEPFHPVLFENSLHRLLALAETSAIENSSSRYIRNSVNEGSIYHLKTSLSQGNGIGSMVSLIDILELSPLSDNGKYYTVDKELLDLLVENNRFSRKMLEDLHFAVDFLNSGLKCQLCPLQELLEKCEERITSISSVLQKKSLATRLSLQIACQDQVLLDEGKFLLAFEELLVNAIKYSIQNSYIEVNASVVAEQLCIKVINFVGEQENTIPDTLKYLILEPFFRIQPPVEDFSEIEKFSLGLGLTVVKYVMEKHKGRFSIHSPAQQTEKNKSVVCEIYLPIVQQ